MNNGNLAVKMTMLCNSNCKNCTSRMKKYKLSEKNYMDFDLFCELVNEAHDYGINHVTFSGGEPTLVPTLTDYIDYATSKGMTTRVMTNGLKLTPDYISELYQSGLKQLCLSLYSTDYQDYTELRNNKRMHEKALQAAKNMSLFSDKMTLIMQTIICRVNYSGIPRLLDFAIDNHFHYLWTSLLEDAINLPQIRMTRDNIEVFNNITIPAIKERSSRLLEKDRDFFLQSADRLFHYPEYADGIYHDKDFSHCHLLGNLFIAFPDGKIGYCSGYDYFSDTEEEFTKGFFNHLNIDKQIEIMHKFCKYCPHGKHVSLQLREAKYKPF